MQNTGGEIEEGFLNKKKRVCAVNKRINWLSCQTSLGFKQVTIMHPENQLNLSRGCGNNNTFERRK